MAKASDTSNDFGKDSNFRILWIIYCTCSLVADPLPTTANLTLRGAYSLQGIFEFAPASKIDPFACPKINADLTFF